MRTNPVKTKLLAGKPVFGSFGWEFLVPGLPQIVKAAGAEFLLLDMEHAGHSYETIKDQAAACRGIELVPMARVPTNQYHYISRALDLGIMGIMAPMVGSAEEAKYIVSCTRYPPAGRRGAAFGFAADDYIGGSVADKIKIANERTLVMCLIETAEGIENVEKIAAVPGVDVLWLGHFDLSNFLGIPGDFANPVFQDAIRKIVGAAKKHGKAAGYMAASAALGKEYLGHGFRMIATGTDQGMLQEATRAMLEGMRK